MEIKIIASGSTGNAYLLEDKGHTLLIECGISFKELRAALEFKTPKLDAVLISHEHKDHSKCAHDLVRMGVPIVASNGTINAIEIDRTFTISAVSEKTLYIGPWWVLPFAVEHDAVEPLGFLIRGPSEEKVLYATDMVFIGRRSFDGEDIFVRYNFKGVNYFMLEANYCDKLLSANERLEAGVVERIRDNHHSIDNLLLFLRDCDLSAAKKIHILHLSNSNADKSDFIRRVQEQTGIPTY